MGSAALLATTLARRTAIAGCAFLTQFLHIGFALLRVHGFQLGTHFGRQVAHASRLTGGVLYCLIYFFHFVRRNGADLRAFAQAVNAIGHNLITSLQVTTHADPVAISNTHGDLALRDRAIGLHQIDVIVLHRIGGHDQRRFKLIDLQLDIDELIGKQPAIGIVKSRLGLDGASRGVNRVVHGIESALGQQLLLVAVPQLYRHVLALRQPHGKHADMLLRQREHSINRLHLGDGDDAVGI